MMDEDRDALCKILRLAACAIRVGVNYPPPIDNATQLMRSAGQRSNSTLRLWACEVAAWANNGFAVGCADNIEMALLVAADAVESGTWFPGKR